MQKIMISILKYKRLEIILALLLMAILTFIMRMYDLPWDGIQYILILIVTFGGGLLFYRGFQYQSKLKILNITKDEIGLTLERLPEPANELEIHYQELLAELLNQKNQMLTRTQNHQAAQNDYYTLWAHQIKTPITAIRLLLQTAYTTKDIAQELFKIEQYVEMVLYYLRLDTITNDFQFEDLSLESLLEDALVKFAPVFIGKGLTLNLAPMDTHVLTDRKWVQFALEQILSNALKYTNKGGVTIYNEGQKLMIEDSGIGINAEDLPRIFERGFTGYNGRVDQKATGIGLYLTHQILVKLGHGIIIESESRAGTKVIIDFSNK